MNPEPCAGLGWVSSHFKNPKMKFFGQCTSGCWVTQALFCKFFLNLTLCMTKLKVLVLIFPNFMDIFYCINVFISHLNVASQSCTCCYNLYCNYFYSHDVFFSLYVALAPSFHVSMLCHNLAHVPTIYIMAIPFMITSSFFILLLH